MRSITLSKSMGFDPIFITKDPDRYFGLRDTGCKLLIVDTDRLDEVKAVIKQNVDIGQLKGIMTTSDFYLEHAARLSNEFQLNSNTIESIQNCRNKALTRRKLAAINIGQPQFEVVDKVELIEPSLQRIGIPCVIKPVDDSASYNVRLCNTMQEARIHIHTILQTTKNIRGQKMAGSALIEEYLDGPEYSVEMFAINGDIVPIGITEKKVTGDPYFVENQHIFPAPLRKDLELRIIDVTKKAIKTLGITHGATHSEIKLIHGEVKVIEINARLAGGMIPELIRIATGDDVLQKQIHCFTNEDQQMDLIEHKKVSGIRFIVSQEAGVLEGISGMNEFSTMPGVSQVVLNRVIGDKVSLPNSAYDRIGYIIATSNSYTEVVSLLDEVNSMIQLKIRKEDQNDDRTS